MLGKYDIKIYNNRVHYFLTVRRNITILQGNSATGKTELIRLLQEYEAQGISSGITLECIVRCAVLTPIDWQLRLGAMHGTIVFIDESAAFVRTRSFAQMVRGSDNYFVIVTRDGLPHLPYSVDEIYGLKNVSDTQKYKSYRRVYNEMYRLYNLETNRGFVADVVITEDSNAGYEFYDIIYPGKCICARGKSSVPKTIRSYEGRKILAIVDGAAFGSEIGQILKYIKYSFADCVIYAPESFEYIILVSGVIDVPREIIEKTYEYADSVRYMSWEEFYTSYLTDITRNSIAQYGKSRLADFYKTSGSVRKMAEVLPRQIMEKNG